MKVKRNKKTLGFSPLNVYSTFIVHYREDKDCPWLIGFLNFISPEETRLSPYFLHLKSKYGEDNIRICKYVLHTNENKRKKV